MLDVDESKTLFIEKNPEMKNIRYCVEYVEHDKEIIDIFRSIVNELIEKKGMCSRRLIYTQIRKQCATIFNVICSELEDKVYVNCKPNPRLRIFDMFHGGTPESVKKHIVLQLSIPDSCLRVVICTIAFGMGVNCSSVNESIHFGAPKSLEAYIQESGRIGRDGSPSISRVLYNAMLLRGEWVFVWVYISLREHIPFFSISSLTIEWKMSMISLSCSTYSTQYLIFFFSGFFSIKSVFDSSTSSIPSTFSLVLFVAVAVNKANLVSGVRRHLNSLSSLYNFLKGFLPLVSEPLSKIYLKFYQHSDLILETSKPIAQAQIF